MRPIEIKAELPQEAINKILGNTKEEMDRMLSPGCTIDLSDGKGRTVTYISFPKGTKPEDVAPAVHAKWIKIGRGKEFDSYMCSACHAKMRSYDAHVRKHMLFCGECGAKTDGIDNEWLAIRDAIR